MTVTFAGSGLTVDVVPVLWEGEANDVGYLIDKDSGDRIRTSVRQHLDFIRGRTSLHPVHLAQLIRFAKRWSGNRSAATATSSARASWWSRSLSTWRRRRGP